MNFLTPLTFNSFFFKQFMEEASPCGAIGILEEKEIQRAFIAIRPENPIPPEFLQGGISIGHQLIEYRGSEIFRLSFKVYEYQDYHLFMNPNNILVKKVLHLMQKNNEFFSFIFSDTSMNAFRDSLGEITSYWLDKNLKIIDDSQANDEDYHHMMDNCVDKYFEGIHLNWVCGHNTEFINLSNEKYRFTIEPSM